MLLVVYVLAALAFGGGAAGVAYMDIEPGQQYLWGNQTVDKFGDLR